MNAIVIAFSIKNQPFTEIVKKLAEIQMKNRSAVLLHGFMNRKTVVKMGYDTAVIDALHAYFPWQFNFYNPAYPNPVFRKQMADVAVALGATVYVIGEIIDGVKIEIDGYRERGLEVVQIPLV